MIRLSIIVPMYNVDRDIERCIRSMQNQDIPSSDYEIICINDGSPDKCKEIVEGLQLEFDNIILINQENRGVSTARNRGIDIAKGRYLLMIDPDDYIRPNCLKNKLDLAELHALEIAYSGYIILNEEMEECYRYDLSPHLSEVIPGIEFHNRYEFGRSEIRDPHRSVAIFLKRDFLNNHNLRYLLDVPFLEDGEFMTRVNCLAKRVNFLSEPFYLRTTRKGSATHSRLYFSTQSREGFLKSAYNLFNFKSTICQDDNERDFINQPIIHFVILYIISLDLLSYLRGYRQLYLTLKKGVFRTLDTEKCPEFYVMMAKRYNSSLHCFYFNWLVYKYRKSFQLRLKRITKSSLDHQISCL